MHPTKRAVIYCRVSTKEQVDEGNSLTTQERLCKEFALKNGYEIAEIFRERGESAKTTNRTELQRLLSYCTDKRNAISVVIAYKLDRVARNIDDYRYIRLLLKKYKIDIKSTTEFFEDTPAGRFMENIIANVSQFDNDVRTERSVNGMKEAIREGRFVGAAPFGYSNVRIDGKHTIAPNEKAGAAKKLFELVAQNKFSIDEIRRSLQGEGLTTANGGMIAKSHLYKILNNETYCGWTVRFGERHKGLYEPLISEQLFDQVQRVLKRRSHKGFLYQRENPSFPLRRFVFHPTGKKLTGSWSQGRSKKYAYYRFIGFKNAEYKKDVLEKGFMKFLDEYAVRPNILGKIKTRLKDVVVSSIEVKRHQSKHLQDQIDEISAKQTSLIQKNEKGVIGDALLRRQLDLLETRLTDLYTELARLPADNTTYNTDVLIDVTRKFLESPGAFWLELPFEKKVALQWFEFPQGVVLENGKFRTTEVASIFNIKRKFELEMTSWVPSGVQDYESSTNTNSEKEFEKYSQIAKDLHTLAHIINPKPP